MTTTYKDMSDRLAPLAHAATSGQTAADYALRNRKARATQDIAAATGTVYVNIVPKLEQAAHLIAAHFVAETAMSAGANSRDMQLFYDDGAGGSATALTSERDGTATAISAQQLAALTVTDGVAIAAGSRIFAKSTHNGASGAALDEVCIEVEYQYD